MVRRRRKPMQNLREKDIFRTSPISWPMPAVWLCRTSNGFRTCKISFGLKMRLPEKLRDILVKAFHEVLQMSQKQEVEMRLGRFDDRHRSRCAGDAMARLVCMIMRVN